MTTVAPQPRTRRATKPRDTSTSHPATTSSPDLSGDTASADTAIADTVIADTVIADTAIDTAIDEPELRDQPDLDEEAGVAADPVRAYLQEIGRTPLLTAEQEVDLSKRIEAGLWAGERLRRARQGEDAEALELLHELELIKADGDFAKVRMVQANLRLVVSVAKKFAHRGLPFLDVVQEGNLGLIRAVEKFDYRKGYKFSTYAMWWIRQAIGRGLAEQARTIRLPVHVNEDLAKLALAERELVQDLGRVPDAHEVAQALGMELERVEELRRWRRDPVSLDTPVGDDGETLLGDLVLDVDDAPAGAVVEAQALASQLETALAVLAPRERRILRLRFGLEDGRPRTLDDVGREIGLTRERVRQLEKQALATLRDPATGIDRLDWAS